MARLEIKNLGSPEETRPFEDKGQMDVVKVGGVTAGRGTFEPGWRWSTHVKPIAGTDWCQSPHTGYAVSGRMRIRMQDGTEEEIRPGDAFVIPPGHDAWVVGSEACVLLDFSGVEMYAKRR